MATEKKIFELEKVIASCRHLDPNELLTLLTFDRNIFWSWGVSQKHYLNKKALRLRVSGHHHKGYVYIVVNGMDLFDVYLTTIHDVIKTEISGLYFDQLVEWIDEKVEKIAAYKS